MALRGGEYDTPLRVVPRSRCNRGPAPTPFVVHQRASMTTDRAIELTVREAALACNVSDKTIRRNLARFPGAYRRDSPAGRSKGPWMIPLPDLVTAGFAVDQPTGGHGDRTPEGDGLFGRLHQLTVEADLLRELLAEVRVRAELAEALAEERRIALDDLRGSRRDAGSEDRLRTRTRKRALPPEHPANSYFDALRTGRNDPKLPFGDT